MNPTTWTTLRSLATLRLWLFILMGVLVGMAAYGVQLVPGVLARQFLDALNAGGAAVSFDLLLPLALLAGFAVVRPAIMIGALVAERGLQLIAGTLVRRNVLDHLLRQPGAQPLPASPAKRSAASGTTSRRSCKDLAGCWIRWAS